MRQLQQFQVFLALVEAGTQEETSRSDMTYQLNHVEYCSHKHFAAMLRRFTATCPLVLTVHAFVAPTCNWGVCIHVKRPLNFVDKLVQFSLCTESTKSPDPIH